MHPTRPVLGWGTVQRTPEPDPVYRSADNSRAFIRILQDPVTMGDHDVWYYLALQHVMLREQQLYLAVSTILKARHDAALAAIRNFR